MLIHKIKLSKRIIVQKILSEKNVGPKKCWYNKSLVKTIFVSVQGQLQLSTGTEHGNHNGKKFAVNQNCRERDTIDTPSYMQQFYVTRLQCFQKLFGVGRFF